MNHGNSIPYTRRHAISLTNVLYKDISVFHKRLFESRQKHNAFLTLCLQEHTAFLWGSLSGYSGHSGHVSTASSHICTRPSHFFVFTKLLQNALSSKTLVFLSCLHLNISVIHPCFLQIIFHCPCKAIQAIGQGTVLLWVCRTKDWNEAASFE